ncbi:uncharacterized protein BDZ99DRAFT_482701 [Mytilinidion resinicola]|uniref:Uncharacterized protein n=1 Tax=Mytilinidion resinicola TaxID=574789 RepID=A0A6A6Y222_9PEZI|nr:uncharacterized protein BDZ99DRAFT_482701 [Mytilinidion resinicola]KAF2802563.1 hypothetical protein BDZ99DRAFT_482701 [Mytilinidion resinicola]
MERGKRPRDPDGDDVEEVPRLDILEVEVIYTAFKKVKIIFEGHELELGVHLAPNGTVEMSFITNSTTNRWIKDETREEASFRNKLVLRPISTQRRQFPFMKLPAEIRLMIYDLVIDSPYIWAYTINRSHWYRNGRLRASIDGTCLPTGRHLGPVRHLLVMNKQMRAEVSVLLFQAFQIDLNYRGYGDPEDCCDLSTTRDVLNAVGPPGRANIKKIRLRWWDSRWNSLQDRADPAFSNVAEEVVNLLKLCGKLDYLHIVIPRHKALRKAGLKPRHFSRTCAFGVLRTVTNVNNVRIHSPGEALGEWLLEGMTGSKTAGNPDFWGWHRRSW